MRDSGTIDSPGFGPIETIATDRNDSIEVGGLHCLICLYLTRCAFGDHHALIEDVDTVRDTGDETEIMIDNNHASADCRGHVANLFDHGDRFGIAHSARGFIEQHERWGHCCSAGEFETSRVAVVKLSCPSMAVLPKASFRNERVNVADRSVAAVYASDQGCGLDILTNGESPEQA